MALEKINSYGTAGWSTIHDANIDELNDFLADVPEDANNALGTTTVAASAVTVNNPAAQTSETLTDSTTGSAGNTIVDCGASYTQATLNNNFASLVDEVNKLRADMAESRTRETEYKAAIAALETKINALLVALRTTTGCGILAG